MPANKCRSILQGSQQEAAAMTTRRIALSSIAAAVYLVACGGGGTDATISGTLSGLGSGLTVTLQNNSAATLTLAANGSFAFATEVAAGGSYSVAVVTQPAGQACSVTGGSGTVATSGTDVSSVAVSCVNTSSLVGVVSGLPAGTSVTLANAGSLLAVAANGAFAFPGTLAVGTAYAVTVAVQPAGHACTVANPSGTIGASGVASVSVSCV